MTLWLGQDIARNIFSAAGFCELVIAHVSNPASGQPLQIPGFFCKPSPAEPIPLGKGHGLTGRERDLCPSPQQSKAPLESFRPEMKNGNLSVPPSKRFGRVFPCSSGWNKD